MAVKENKTRIAITVSMEFKEKLEKTAKEQNRTINNLIATILKEYYENNEK